jgi:colanic acid biosynthesis glycosyl transferase WcaI
MRILIYGINFSPEWTGVGKYTGEMAEWLASRGHAVSVVTAPPHYPQWQVPAEYSAWRYQSDRYHPPSGGTLEIHRCPLWVPRAPHGLRRILHLASFALASFPVAARQVFWRPDIVLIIEPTFLCAPLGQWVARQSSAAAWLHIQDFEVDAAFGLGDLSSDWARRGALAAERFVLRRFDRVSAISEKMCQRLLEKGVACSRVAQFPNWVDTSAIHPLARPSVLREKLRLPGRAIVALYSGSMGRKHGLEFLAQASRRVASRADIQFVFCGQGPCLSALMKTCQEAGNVHFLPLQSPEQLNELLNLADIHLLPQRSDAEDLVMPSKLTGMLASGRPVVATARPGTQLWRDLDGRGMVTSPGDVEAFAAALVQLADDPGLRRSLGQAGRNYAVQHLDREEILGRFERALLECTNGRETGSREPAPAGQPGKMSMQ